MNIALGESLTESNLPTNATPHQFPSVSSPAVPDPPRLFPPHCSLSDQRKIVAHGNSRLRACPHQKRKIRERYLLPPKGSVTKLKQSYWILADAPVPASHQTKPRIFSLAHQEDIPVLQKLFKCLGEDPGSALVRLYVEDDGVAF